MKRALTLLSVFLVGAVSSSCATFAVAAATVNGQRISEDDVESQLVLLNNDPAFGDALRQDPNVARGEGRRQILTTLIYGAVAEQQARKRGISPSTNAVDRLIRERATSDGLTVNQFLRAQKLTLAQARQIGRRLVLDFELEQKVLGDVTVSEEAIKRAYEQNKSSFEEAHLARITVNSSNDVRDVLEKAGSGADFAQLARDKSTDPLATRGGDMGWVTVSRLAPQEQEAIARAKTGGVTDPIPTQSAFEVFKIIDRRTKPLSQASAEIRSGLLRSKRTQDYRTWLEGRVRASKVVVNPQYGRFDRKQAIVVPASRSLRP